MLYLLYRSIPFEGGFVYGVYDNPEDLIRDILTLPEYTINEIDMEMIQVNTKTNLPI